MANSMTKSILNRIRNSDSYFIAGAKLAFALELKKAMDRLGISNSDLAERLGVSRPMVTKLLRGDANLTIETMVKAARKLDGQLHIGIVRNGCDAKLLEVARAAVVRNREAVAALERTEKVSALNAWHVAANDIDQTDDADEDQPLAA